MLKFWLFIICSLIMVYLKVIDDIQCYIFLQRTSFLYTINTNKIFPTTVLAFLVTSNSSLFTFYN